MKYKDACCEMFKNWTDEDIENVRNLPNFNSDILFEITGIRI